MNRGDPYLGVYYSVDVSTYDEVYPLNPNEHVKEIAGLFIELIQLLIDMQYLNKEQVAFPPHTECPLNLKYPARYGLTKDVVDMYQMIPYVTGFPNWNHGSDGGEFVHGGEFLADLRQVDSEEDSTGSWEQAVIDPTYGIDWRNWDHEADKAQWRWGAENGPYIRPWFAVLSEIGNHGAFMCLNTKNWHMWLVYQLGGTADPALKGLPSRPEKPNRNDLENEHSRPAVDLLRDIIQRFKSLEWLPGGLYSDEWPNYSPMKKHYEDAGWPDKFDPATFNRLRLEYDKAVEEFRHQADPLDSLATQMMWENLGVGNEKISPEEWERIQADLQKQLDAQKAERQQFLDRQGRFSGMSDEEHEQAVKDGWFEDQIKDLEVFLVDKSPEARRTRINKEIREKAAAVDPAIIERWLQEQVKWDGKDENWVAEWRAYYAAGQSKSEGKKG